MQSDVNGGMLFQGEPRNMADGRDSREESRKGRTQELGEKKHSSRRDMRPCVQRKRDTALTNLRGGYTSGRGSGELGRGPEDNGATSAGKEGGSTNERGRKGHKENPGKRRRLLPYSEEYQSPAKEGSMKASEPSKGDGFHVKRRQAPETRKEAEF